MITTEHHTRINEQLDRLVDGKQPGQSICAYIYDLEKLRRHAAQLKTSLPDFCRLFYAIKANPDPKLLHVLDEVVDGFEVASGGEIRTAKSCSTKPVLFGAPAKKEYEIDHIVKGDVQVTNIESFHDIDRLQYRAAIAGQIIPVTLRVNLSENVSNSHLKMSGVPTQFGIDERTIHEAIRNVTSSRNLKLKGFHFHAMSNNLDATSHVLFIEQCIQKSLDWSRDHQLRLEMVNVGGGVGINYFDPSTPFDWETLSTGLHDLSNAYDEIGFELVLELGRYMVADCGYYAAEVIDIKENHSETFALLRGGSHHLRLPAAWKMSHPFFIRSVDRWEYPYERPMTGGRPVTLTGELCTPNDVLARGVPVNELKAGDIVVFYLAGAYAWTISHHDFLSHPYPEMIYVN